MGHENLERVEWTSGLNKKLHTQLSSDLFKGYEEVDPLSLITSNRFDVLIKLKCVSLLDQGATESSKSLYLSHIKNINNFREGDGLKSSPVEFWESFIGLYESFKEFGFDHRKSIIPVDSNGRIIDGAHRVAMAIYFKQKLKIARFNYNSQIKLPSDFFFNDNQSYLFSVLMNYIYFDRKKRVSILWPISMEQDSFSLAKQAFEFQLGTFTKAEVKLTSIGLRNFMVNTYQNESWVGGTEKKFKGIENKFRACRGNGNKQTLMLYVSDDVGLTGYKEDLRATLGIANHSIHTTDTAEEAIDILKVLSNEDSIFSLNMINLEQVSTQTYNFIEKFSSHSDHAAITSSLVLDLFKQRLPIDCDYLSSKDLNLEFASNHYSQLKYYPTGLSEILSSHSGTFYFIGLKFVSLSVVLKMKYKRMEFKDAKDLMKFNSFIPFSWTLIACFYYVVRNIQMIKKRFLKKMNSLQMKAVEAKHVFIYCLFSLFPFGFRYFRYMGFWGKSDKHDSLVRRLKKGGVYEKKVSEKLISLLPENGVFIDVGANIGLVSLYVLRMRTPKMIYAFEPGPNQFRYLESNIKRNKLKNKIEISNVALGAMSGNRNFYVHSREHSSGDGFVDTERAGQAIEIKVTCLTLDEYLEANFVDQVDLIKIDTEGAELEILKGAVQTIEKFKPKIVFEWWPANYVKQGLAGSEIFDFFSKYSYQIKTLNGVLLDLDSFRTCQGTEDMFIAEHI